MKINFEIDICRLKLQFVELDFSNLIFQNLSTDQQGVSTTTTLKSPWLEPLSALLSLVAAHTVSAVARAMPVHS